MTDGSPVACTQCGRRQDHGWQLLTWSSATGPRGTTWTCPDCTRRHVRSVEARLGQEHW